MLSSTSSSNQRLPVLPWLRLWVPALLLVVLLAALLEFRLALRGIAPTQLDSEARWLEERSRASSDGPQSLVLIGASRIQLGIDVPLLQRLSGKPTHQLAIDGSSYWPVLRGLASDDTFNGTVIVDYYHHTQLDNASGGLAASYEQRYQEKKAQLRQWHFDRLENILEWHWRGQLRSYADGARPLDSLFYRIFNQPQMPQYLRTNFDRSRDADYRKLPMPDFYFARVRRSLGEHAPPANLDRYRTYPEVFAALQQAINALPHADTRGLVEKHRRLRATVEKIQARGGQVIFLVMPSSGLVREIEQRQYPDSQFLLPLQQSLPAQVINSSSQPQLADFVCPDGSHLDYRDKARFTTAFAHIAGLARR